MRYKSRSHSSPNVAGENKSSIFFSIHFFIISFLIVTYYFRESHVDLCKQNIYKFYSKYALHVLKMGCFCLFKEK